MKILNLTSIIHNGNFSHDGSFTEIVNIKRNNIEKIWEARNAWGHIDTERLMDQLPDLVEVASECCDGHYLGVLAGVFDGGFGGLCRYHESFGYKCAEIISAHSSRQRLRSFVGIKHSGIYILHQVPLSVKLLVL